jgi:8-oxo-dGTP pyrophosphatase MutT (NUDIX family)
MEITCGSFLIDPLNRILMCLTTGTKNFWTVPKGLPESHESFYEAAVRELEEETGIDITKFNWAKKTHDAVDDCRFQVEYCTEAMRSLNIKI